MTLPGVLLGFLLATACGLAFHVVRGGSLARLALYVVTAWVCFFAGQLFSDWIGWTPARLGSLNLLPALTATLLGLVAASVLAKPEGSRSTKSTTETPPEDSE